MKINGHLIFESLGSELRNVVIEKLAADPASTESARIYYNTTTNGYRFYNGTGWGDFGNATLAESLNGTLGGITSADGSFDGTAVDAALSSVTESTDLLDVLTQMNAAITNAASGNDFSTIVSNIGTFSADEAGSTLHIQSQENAGLHGTATGAGTKVEFKLTPMSLPTTAAVVDMDDLIILSDTLDAATDVPTKVSLSNVVVDLGILTQDDIGTIVGEPSSIGDTAGTGFLVKTGADSYLTTSLLASTVGTSKGIIITDGSGSGGVPTIGLGISALDTAAAIEGNDEFLLFDGSSNLKTTFTSVHNLFKTIGTSLTELSNVTDGTAKTLDVPTILVGDGTNLTNVDLIAGTDLSGVSVAGTSYTINVDDSFLRNTGDTLSGTLTIENGSSIVVETGAQLTMADAPTSANDVVNKAYVDTLVSSGTEWRDSVVDANLVDVVAVNPADPEAAYTLSVNDSVSFIATAAFTFAMGTGTTVAAVTGDVVSLKVTSGGNGDYALLEQPLSAGDRFIVTAQSGSCVGGTLDGFSPSITNGELIEFNGTGDGSLLTSWDFPDGHSTASSATPKMVQGITVLVSDPQSQSYSHTYMYSTEATRWVEITGPGSVGDGTGLSYTGSTLNVGTGSGIASVGSTAIGLDLYSAIGALILSTDGTTHNPANSASKLTLKLKGTSLTQDTDGLYVNAVDNSALANSTFTFTDGLTPWSAALGDTITVVSSQGVTVDTTTGATINIVGDLATTTSLGVAKFNNNAFDVDASGQVSLKSNLAFNSFEDGDGDTYITLDPFENDDDEIAMYLGDNNAEYTSDVASISLTKPLITIQGSGGEEVAIAGGDVEILAGESMQSTGGEVRIIGGYGDGGSGKVVITGGESMDVGGDVVLAGGLSGMSSGGNIILQPGEGDVNTSAVVVKGSKSSEAGELRLMTATNTGSDYVGFLASTSLAATTEYVFPAAMGSANEALVISSIAGTVATLDWATPSGTLGNLTDVTEPGANSAGNTVVYNGAGYDITPTQYILDGSVAATSFTITHNLNQKYVNVTVYDSSDVQILPQSVTLSNANELVVTFNTAITCTVVIMGIAGVVPT